MAWGVRGGGGDGAVDVMGAAGGCAAGSKEEAAWKPLPMLLRLVVFLQPPTSLGSQPLQLSDYF